MGLIRLSAAFLLTLAAFAPAQAAERILHLDTHIVLAEDATLEVTETAKVAFDAGPDDGLSRFLPTIRQGAQSSVEHVTYEITSIRRNGRDLDHTVSIENDGARLFLDKPDDVKPGDTATYELRFKATGVIDFNADRDFLYWRSVENNWSAPIESASFAVELPSAAKTFDYGAFTGSADRPGRKFAYDSHDPRVFAANTTKDFTAGEEFAAVLSFPKGDLQTIYAGSTASGISDQTSGAAPAENSADSTPAPAVPNDSFAASMAEATRMADAMNKIARAEEIEAATPEGITSFDSAITIGADASVDVTETLNVKVMGDQIKHGIYRDIPTRYKDASGRDFVARIEVVSVTRDGGDEPYVVQDIDNGIRIKIGNADAYLDERATTYAIRYRAMREIGFFGDHDELYWNVTGSQWDFPIGRASINVKLPPGATITETAAFTGPPGTRGEDWKIDSSTGTAFLARTTAPLPPGSGFTVAVGWPKGFVAQPSTTTDTLWLLQDNAPAFICIFGIAAAALYFYLSWRWVGRDPRSGVIVPLFHPPEGLTAAAVRYVREEGFDDTGFSCALIGLAVKGYLRIESLPKSYRLVPLEKDRSGLPGEEASLLGALGSSAVDLVPSNHVTVGGARKRLAEILANSYLGTSFELNRGWFYTGAALSVAVVLIAFMVGPWHFPNLLNIPRGVFHALTYAVAIAATFILPPVSKALSEYLSPAGWTGLTGSIRPRALAPAAVALLAVLVILLLSGALSFNTVMILIAIPVLAGLNFTFYVLLTAPTVSGRALLDQIEGFRLYLTATEEDRLNVLHPPERTPELFERYLPYAVALGCSWVWGQKFKDVLSSADTPQQTWYVGNSSGYWSNDHYGFADSLGDSLATSTASAAVAPGSSSGFGGGGGSGGGGGGGGGGGW